MKTDKDPLQLVKLADLLAKCFEDGDCLKMSESRGKCYQNMRIEGVQYQTLRVMYAMHKRIRWADLAGKRVWPICGDRKCVNPAHGMHGTVAEHRQWLASQGRAKLTPVARAKLTAFARSRPSTKLTPEKVAEIRASTESGQAIAKRLGCSKETVLAARRGEHWRSPETRATPFSGLF